MPIRPAAVAGQFYPAVAEQLKSDVRRYIEDSGIAPHPEGVAAIVSPHAGYMYSGPCAGYVYSRIQGMRPKRVVVLGRSHRYGFTGASIYASGAFETPLGSLPVDESLAGALIKAVGSTSVQAHEYEHALEVQLPFIQVVLGDVPIVPVLFGSDPDDWHVDFGRMLGELLGETDLVIASTDLSHFLSQEQANRIDRHSLDCVLRQDPALLSRELATEASSMCGGTAVVVAMAYALARNATDWQLLDYRTSASVSGDYDRVVGYGAVSMERAA